MPKRCSPVLYENDDAEHCCEQEEVDGSDDAGAEVPHCETREHNSYTAQHSKVVIHSLY